jgi:hypothetical protein
MDRRSSSFLLVLLTFFLLALSGCVGKSSSNTGNGSVQTVTLSPIADVSLELGTTQSFSATARNGKGQIVFDTIHFSSSNNASLTIANNGQACAGTWDSLSAPVVCTPGVAGVADITAVVDGVSSAPTTVFVHQHIQSITVAPVGTHQCLNPPCTCFSQGETFDFQATALSANNVDITNTVGPMAWSSTPANVLTVDSVKGLPNNQIQVTAKDPGVTQLFANVSGTTSTPLDYTTCLVKSIMLQVQNGSGNSVTISAGGTKTIEAIVVDTLDVTLSKPPLTFSTSNPEIATVSTSGVVTARQTAGAANISASCTPPTCNIGILPGLPIYSTGGTPQNGQPAFGVITAHVTNTKVPAATAWTATTDCKDAFNCTSVMFPVAAGTNPVGASVTLPFTPNSLLFNAPGTRAYLGSSKGLMFVDFGQNVTVGTVSQATTPCNVAVCGKPLTISADGNRVVVSDTTTDPNQVYIFDAGHPSNPPVDLLIPGATAAAFSPDQMKIFILSDTGKMYVFSTVDSLLSVPVSAAATGVSFAADGSFAYVAGTPGNSVSGYSVCTTNNIPNNVLSGVPLPGFPLAISPLPGLQFDHLGRLAQSVLSLTPPSIDIFTVGFAQNPPVEQPPNSGDFFCQPPTVALDEIDFPPTSFNLGQGNFTPLSTQVTGDGSQVILLAQNIPAVLVFDVNSGTTSAFSLTGSAFPFAATATLDGTQVFVAACDSFQDGDPAKPCLNGSVHIVNTQSGGDIQQAVYTNVNTNNSMCSNLDPAQPPCLPKLVAVRPQ